MKKIKLLLALGFASCMANAQVIYTVAGTGTAGFSGDGGQATAANIRCEGVTFDASGNMYIAGGGSDNRIRKVTTAGIISTIAGIGTYTYSGDGGQATAAGLADPHQIAFDASGNIYIADAAFGRIRKINTSGIISTFAGGGGSLGDGGQASAAQLSNPRGVAIDASGNIYIADQYNHRIRKVNTSGIINTIAGTGVAGFSGDGGQATAAKLYQPEEITIDASGNIYVADEGNNAVRKITSAGIISTFAGTGGIGGYTGDGGQATAAKLSNPEGIVIDASGNIYIADGGNSVIRMVSTSGIINAFAGTGVAGFSGDGGPANAAKLGSYPYGIAKDASNNIYIADDYNNRIRMVNHLCYANAGSNVINQQTCCGWGAGVQIGTPAVANMSYSWTPNTLLSPNTTTATPTSSWTNTSTCQIYTVTVSYSLCTTNTSTVQVCAHAYTGTSCCRFAATGIATQNQQAVNFVIYPNPSSGQITISLYDKAEYIRMVDMQGRLVYEIKDVDMQEFKLDISKYNKGVYFISAKIGDTVEKQKLIVE